VVRRVDGRYYWYQLDVELISGLFFSVRRTKLDQELSNMHNRICKLGENKFLFCARNPEEKGTVFLNDYGLETRPPPPILKEDFSGFSEQGGCLHILILAKVNGSEKATNFLGIIRSNCMLII
jgi:hypothetical protein